jgi:8-oxo-dGTP diphosphatase
MTKIVEVAAAVLLRGDGVTPEFLLAQRPEGKVYAGYWEFPGGKVEAGETMRDALVRELQEELGITVDRAWPWLCREFTYPHATVRLKFFRVASWHGEIAPIEHSGFAWQRPGVAATVAPILPANDPILRALELPPVYALSNAEENGVDAELARIRQGVSNGFRLIQIRDKTLPSAERRRLAEGTMSIARTCPDARVLINDDDALALAVGAHGVHLSSSRLATIGERPAFEWVGASCHTADELVRAAELDIDFAVLGPLLPTPTHPQAAGLGWQEFARLVERSPLPVFALGGMRQEMLETAWENGAHGIALMRGWR